MRVELELVNLTDQVLKQTVRHGGLARHKVDTVVGAGDIGAAVILDSVVFTITNAHQNDRVVNRWGKGREALLVVTGFA